jgi:threonine synthase
MDAMIIANRNGNIACTQGGESMAGLKKAVQEGHVKRGEVGILDSTAHMLKFLTFQEMYFQDTFGPEFEIRPRKDLKNASILVKPERLKTFPEPGNPLPAEEMQQYVQEMTAEIARILKLEKK